MMLFVNLFSYQLHETAIPRHREINDLLARKICRDLQVPAPNV